MDAQTEYLTDLAAALQETADRLNALLMAQRRGAEDAGWEDTRREGPPTVTLHGYVDGRPLMFTAIDDLQPLPGKAAVCGAYVLGVRCETDETRIAIAALVSQRVCEVRALCAAAGVPCPPESPAEPEKPQPDNTTVMDDVVTDPMTMTDAQRQQLAEWAAQVGRATGLPYVHGDLLVRLSPPEPATPEPECPQCAYAEKRIAELEAKYSRLAEDKHNLVRQIVEIADRQLADLDAPEVNGDE